MTREAVLCPYHTEQTPSLVIDHKRQTYTCLGCTASGPLTNLADPLRGYAVWADLDEARKMYPPHG